MGEHGAGAAVRSAADGVADAPSTDGRRLRGARSREAVVEAMLELIRAGDRQPSAAEIAARAGVSVRSVFRHFDDLDSLYGLAVERQIERIVPLLDLGALPDDLEARIELLVDRRAHLFEDISPVRHVGEHLQERSPVLRRHMAESQSWLREQTLSTFAAELDAVPDTERRDLADALDVTTSWRAWVALREDQGRSVARSRSVVVRMLSSLLA